MSAEPITKALSRWKASCGWRACRPANEDMHPLLSDRNHDSGGKAQSCGHACCDQGHGTTGRIACLLTVFPSGRIGAGKGGEGGVL